MLPEPPGPPEFRAKTRNLSSLPAVPDCIGATDVILIAGPPRLGSDGVAFRSSGAVLTTEVSGCARGVVRETVLAAVRRFVGEYKPVDVGASG